MPDSTSQATKPKTRSQRRETPQKTAHAPTQPLGPEPHTDLLAWRDEFPILQRKTYLNSCSLGPLSRRAMAAMERFEEQWNEHGAQSWYGMWMGELAALRAKVARLIGAQPHEIAIAPSVSGALSEIASGLDLGARNKVVCADMDFPTLAYQWLARERQGVEVAFVESEDRITLPAERFRAQIDKRTGLVATSRVFYLSGYIQDVAKLAKMAHTKGALLLVDDYQATGQWLLKHGGTRTTALSEPGTLLDRFYRRELDIRPGDALRCRVDVETSYGPDHEVLAERYRIVEIIEVLPASAGQHEPAEARSAIPLADSHAEALQPAS